MTIDNDNKVYLWGCLIAILIPCIFACLLVAGMYVGIIFIIHDKTNGDNYKAANHQYYVAMREGRGKDAIHWAERIHYHQKKNDLFYPHDNLLGYAYELNSEYEKALESYTNSQKKLGISDGYSGELDDLLHVPRVKYKLNQKNEAFRGYCHYARHCLAKYSNDLAFKEYPVGSAGWYSRNNSLGNIRYPITMEQSTLMRLTPFLEYRDFIDFMEEEYRSLGEPPEYAAAMKLLRAIDTEIDEERLPRSSASNLCSEFRETIRQERAQKQVDMP